MLQSNRMPFSPDGGERWEVFNGLNLPPEIAALLRPAALEPTADAPSHGPLVGSPSSALHFPPPACEGLAIAHIDGPAGLDEVAGVAPGVAAAENVSSPIVLPNPPMVPRVRLAGPRRCGHCHAPGHDKRACPSLGRAAPNPNRNAISVQQLPPVARRSVAATEAGDAAVVGAAPEAVLLDHLDSDAHDFAEGDDNSVVSGSGSESEVDADACLGFEGVQWHQHFDSSLPESDSNRCGAPPPLPRRRQRRSVPSSSSDSEQSVSSMDGAPAFSRDDCPHARRIPREANSPAMFVQLLFPQFLIEQLVQWTNAAAEAHPRLMHQARYVNWREATNKEMYTFLAICVYLGVVKVQNRKVIWKRGGLFEQKWVSSRMSLRRFESLLNAFNCCAPWNLSDAEMATNMASDAFWQVKDFVQECNERCAYHFKMGRSFSIDEAVIPFKGRHRARCYNPKKPAKYHLKKFSLNCAATGYVYCHYHYGGKDERRPPGVPASLWPIKKLVDQCQQLHNKNHFCATDNWYTSAQSLAYFRRRGIHCAGTIKKSRLGLQTSTRPGFPTAATFKAARGQPKRARADCMIHSTHVDGHEAYVTTWQDKKPVLVLSSYPPARGVCSRKIKVGRAWTRQEFFRPNVIAHYNKTMGGTDLHDQRLAFARSTVKSRRWQVCSCCHEQQRTYPWPASRSNRLVHKHAHERICAVQVT